MVYMVQKIMVGDKCYEPKELSLRLAFCVLILNSVKQEVLLMSFPALSRCTRLQLSPA